MAKAKNTVGTFSKKGVYIIVHDGCNCDSSQIMHLFEEGLALGVSLDNNYMFGCMFPAMCEPRGKMSKGEAFLKQSCKMIDWYKKGKKRGIFLIMDGLEILDTEYLNSLMEHAVKNKEITLITAARRDVVNRIRPDLRKKIRILG